MLNLREFNQALWISIPMEGGMEMHTIPRYFILPKDSQIEWLTRGKKGGVNIRQNWILSKRTNALISQQKLEEDLDNPDRHI